MRTRDAASLVVRHSNLPQERKNEITEVIKHVLQKPKTAKSSPGKVRTVFKAKESTAGFSGGYASSKANKLVIDTDELKQVIRGLKNMENQMRTVENRARVARSALLQDLNDVDLLSAERREIREAITAVEVVLFVVRQNLIPDWRRHWESVASEFTAIDKDFARRARALWI